ncbi:hypothetical protein [Pseudoruegeria sp. HB172150]|uniref:hypothetical protein n=1 Tax=Pseudoruegeria sp. HB172150 TaxID=2721164 RepID=UPI0015574F8E|nr:hypothetical protein [Pseudoruegeria sp. HB172150]
MSGPLFDTHVVIDWSARSRPSPARPTKDAIWFAVVRYGEAEAPVYCRTRHEARGRLTELFVAEADAGRRVLAGFDFPFGYPAGVAAKVSGGKGALDLWDWIAGRVQDRDDNTSNRFEVAAEINRLYPGVGPFWGRPQSWDYPEIPIGGRARHGHGHPPERRIADRLAKGAKTVWQLAYTGSVGSQVILGLPTLAALRNHPELAGRIAVWPFDSGLAVPDAQIVLAEIYPSLLQKEAHAAREDAEVLDSAQVRINAEAFSRLDRSGGLAALFGGSSDLTEEERRVIETEEAWILGLGHETALRSAAVKEAACAPI